MGNQHSGAKDSFLMYEGRPVRPGPKGRFVVAIDIGATRTAIVVSVLQSGEAEV